MVVTQPPSATAAAAWDWRSAARPASADALLRMTRRAGNDNKPAPAPRALAVKGWAWRRGRRCGTAWAELERAAVDLLPDRQAETLIERLRRTRPRRQGAGLCCATAMPSAPAPDGAKPAAAARPPVPGVKRAARKPHGCVRPAFASRASPRGLAPTAR